MNNIKISIIGAGNVGATCASKLVQKNMGDIVLIDIAGDMAKGKSMDIGQSGAIESFQYTIDGGDDYSLIKDSSIVVITAGLARRPGMSRDDLLHKNTEIVKGISEKVKKYAPESIVIVVTNPMDVMAYVVYKTTGFSWQKVIGMGGILDSGRFRYFISQAFSTASVEVEGFVVGAHGDSMVPVASKVKVSGKLLNQLLPEDKINTLVHRTKHGGAEIVSYLGSGSAYVAPAAAIVSMIESILNGEKNTRPCSVLLPEKYGYSDIYCGIPVTLGIKGVEQIDDLDLTDQEHNAFLESCKQIKEQIEKIKNIL